MKAILLAAGKGTRLGNLTKDRPKALLPLGGAALINYMLNYLRSQGILEVGINLHHQAQMVQDHVGGGSRFGLTVEYVLEEELTGTAGAVLKFRDWLSGASSFLVVYGDLLIDQPLQPVRAFHDHRSAEATLLVHRRAGSNSIVDLDALGRITRFEERPQAVEGDRSRSSWVNSGYYLFDESILDRIPVDQFADFPVDVFEPFYTQAAFFGFPLTGYRCAIDSPERYRQAQMDIESGIFPVFGMKEAQSGA